MIPAVKHLDPVMGVDAHLIQPPAPGPPVPVPHPFIGMIFDPVDYLPVIGATVYVNNLPAAIAGTGAQPTPHIPIGGTFVKIPGNEGEMFMGSSTVTFDGEAASYGALPVLSCQSVGMTPPPRPKSKKSKVRSLVLPTTTVMPLPVGPPVLVGGAPTISLMALGMRAAMSGLGKMFKKLRRLQKGSKRWRRLSRRLQRKADNALDKLGVSNASRVRNRVKRAICTVTGHPVDVATGKVFTDAVDLELPGPLPFRLERVWQSTSRYRGPLGHGWHHNFDMAVWEDVDEGVVVARLEDGRHALFAPPTRETPSYNRQEQLWLHRTDRGYRLEEAVGDRRFVFTELSRGSGRSRRAPVPHRLSRVEDPNGNAIRLRYDRQGHLSELIDSAGRQLAVATDSGGGIRRIDGPHPDDEGRRITLLEYRYDDRGNLAEVRDAHGEPYRYSYEDHLLVKETDRAGVSFFFEYDGTDEDARCVRTWGTNGVYERTLNYDVEEQKTTVVDTRDAEMVYHWTDQGVVTKEVDPKGAETTRTYDEDGNKLTETDPLGNTTEYEYDAMGRLVRLTRSDGNHRTLKYSERGNVIAVTDELGHTWERSFDARGNIVDLTDPIGAVTRYEVDERGLLTSVLDANGQEIQLSWDDAGNLRRLTDRTGAVIQLQFDRLGRCTHRIDPQGAVTHFQRDLLGRITKVVDGLGRSSRLDYDPAGNIIKLTDPGGNQRTFDYRPISPGGELVKVTEPDGSLAHFSYDKEGQLIAVRDPTGRSWQLERCQSGRVIKERDFVNREISYQYDLAGELIQMTDSLGRDTILERDSLGRLTKRDYSDGQTEVFSYDAAGRLTKAENDTTVVTFEYDSAGRVVRETQDEHEVWHEYDPSGNRVGRGSSTGRPLTFTYDFEGRLKSINDPVGPLLMSERDNLGRETVRYVPGEIRAEREYSRTGELLSQRVAGQRSTNQAWSRRYRYSSLGHLSELYDTRSGRWKFIHNERGFLERVIDPADHVKAFDHDRAGNVPAAPFSVSLSASDASGDSGLQSSPLSGAADVDNRAQQVELSDHRDLDVRFDGAGNLVRKRTDGSLWTFAFNAAGRLESVTCDGDSIAEFEYDALSRRVAKRTRESEVRYRWEGNQLLSQEVEVLAKDGVGESVTPELCSGEFVFLEFEPLVFLSDKGDRIFETDPVGTPLAMFSRNGRIVWEATPGLSEAFPEAYEDWDLSIGHPGQMWDRETGLAYNRYRYYDPDLNCYIQPDPVGLLGGMCSFNYVADPLSTTDPLGLSEGDQLDDLITRGGADEISGDYGEEDLVEYLDESRRTKIRKNPLQSMSPVERTQAHGYRVIGGAYTNKITGPIIDAAQEYAKDAAGPPGIPDLVQFVVDVYEGYKRRNEDVLDRVLRDLDDPDCS